MEKQGNDPWAVDQSSAPCRVSPVLGGGVGGQQGLKVEGAHIQPVAHLCWGAGRDLVVVTDVELYPPHLFLSAVLGPWGSRGARERDRHNQKAAQAELARQRSESDQSLAEQCRSVRLTVDLAASSKCGV